MNPTVNEIAQDIYTRAKAKGLDPNVALGLALREGLNRNTVGSSVFGNRDAKGYSYGPWQLYSGSPVAGAVAPGGQAAQFMRQFGQRPSAANWREQNEFALNLFKRLSPQQRLTTWYAIRDNGGEQALARIGLQNAMRMGLTPGGAVAPVTPASGGSPVTPASAPAPMTPSDTPAPATPMDIAPPPPPPEDDYEGSQFAGLEAMPDEAGGAVAEMPSVDPSAMPVDFGQSDPSGGAFSTMAQKAANGRQRMSDLVTPLGQIFQIENFGMAGKGRG